MGYSDYILRREDKLYMKVTLVSSWYDAYGEAKFADRLGILYLAAYLEKNNIQVEIIDALWDNLSLKELGELILQSKPDLVGVSCFSGTRFSDFDVIRMVKKVSSRSITVLGGPQATPTAEDILSHIPEVDFIVLGEGELTLLELCRNLESSQGVYLTQGIAYFKDGRYVQNPNRSFIEDLSTLPFPARHLHPKYKTLDPSRMFYVDTPVGNHKERFSSVHVMASRGCPYNCSFCSTTQFWHQRTRFRSVQNVVEELESLKDLYGITVFNFADDTLNVDMKYLTSLCDLMIKKKLNCQWQCNFRANDNAAKDVLIKMKEAGCTGIRMGVESGSPRILKQVKGITREQVRRIASWCDQIGLVRRLNFIINFPGETIEEAKSTVEFAKEFGEPFLVAPLVIFPGTQIEKIAKQNGCLPKDFSWADPHPHLRYSLPGRFTTQPMFVGDIPFQQVVDLIFQLEGERKKLFSLPKRIRELLKNIKSIEDFKKLFSFSNFLFLFGYIKFKFSRFILKKKK